jgi:hypothetical protein
MKNLKNSEVSFINEANQKISARNVVEYSIKVENATIVQLNK